MFTPYDDDDDVHCSPRQRETLGLPRECRPPNKLLEAPQSSASVAINYGIMVRSVAIMVRSVVVVIACCNSKISSEEMIMRL